MQSLYPPVFLPPSLYEAAEREGYDMRGYAKQQRILVSNMRWVPREEAEERWSSSNKPKRT